MRRTRPRLASTLRVHPHHRSRKSFPSCLAPTVVAKVAVGECSDGTDGDAHATGRAERVGQVFTIGRGDRGFETAVGTLDCGDAIISSQTRVQRLHMMQRSHL